MKIIMPNVYLYSGRYSHEKKDCTVIALAYAWQITYEEAHALLKKAGRKDNEGFDIIKNLLKVSPNKKYRQFKNRGVSYHKRPGMSVKKFIETHPKGTYMIYVSGHVFTLVDGVKMNQESLTQIVHSYCYITEDFSKTSQQKLKILRISKIDCERGSRLVFLVCRNGVEHTLELDGERYGKLYNNPNIASAVINRMPNLEELLRPVNQQEEEEESFSESLSRVIQGNHKKEWEIKFASAPEEIKDICKDYGYEIVSQEGVSVVEKKKVFTTTQFAGFSWVWQYYGEYGRPQFLAYFSNMRHNKDKKTPDSVYSITKTII